MPESQLALPLLNDFDGDEESTSQLPNTNDIDEDEEIIYQLLNTNDNNERRQRSGRHNYSKFTRRRNIAILYALLLLFGFMSSIWAAASCKLVQIEYNKGGLELSIEGVGFWRYCQKLTNGTHTTNYCAPFGQQVHSEVNLDGFFPDDKFLQAYSVVSPSTVFASIFALMICLVEVQVQPEILFGLIPEHVDPSTTIRSSALAGVLLMVGAIIQMVATFSLLHYHPQSTASGYESPLCNPAYSHCKLGPIGIWAVIGALALFFAGVISCYSSHRIARRHGKGKMCDTAQPLSSPLLSEIGEAEIHFI